MSPAKVTQLRLPGDPKYLDSFQVNERIRAAVRYLADRGFDWDGHEGLPLRADVHDEIVNRLCFAEGDECAIAPLLLGGGLSIPTVALNHDGTATITFAEDARTLKLHVVCGKVILYSRIFDDGVTRIDGRLSHRDDEARDELRALLEWLREVHY